MPGVREEKNVEKQVTTALLLLLLLWSSPTATTRPIRHTTSKTHMDSRWMEPPMWALLEEKDTVLHSFSTHNAADEKGDSCVFKD